MKWFVPVFIAPFAALGLFNIISLVRAVKKRRLILNFFIFFILLSICFSTYYQFIHFIPKTDERRINERFLEESTYQAGLWMRKNSNGSAISHVPLFGYRFFAISEKTHLLTPSLTINQIYGFNELNISKFRRYPITSEKFWFKGYEGLAIGERTWDYINMMYWSYREYGIKYFVENLRAGGNVVWHHGVYPSKLLHFAYNEKDCIYNNGRVRIWNL